MNSISRFIKNIFYTFFANGFSLLISTISMLFLPKILNVRGYGFWQLYVLYTSYLGIFHLGLCDGIYIKYGGRSYKDLNKKLFSQQLEILFFFVVFSALLLMLVLFNINDIDIDKREIILCTIIASILYIPKTYLLMAMQALGDFKAFSRTTIYERFAFGAIMLIFLYFRLDNFIYYVYADLFGRFIVLIYSLRIFQHYLSIKNGISKIAIKECIKDICTGFPILLSGLASNLIIGLIRFFIEDKWSIVDFSKISLSLSMLNLFLSFVNMVGLVLFPILKNTENESLQKIFKLSDKMSVFLLLFSLALGAPIVVFIHFWLPNYADSIQQFCVLLPCCIIECKMSMVCISYFKSLYMQKELLYVNILTVVCSGFLSWIVVYKLQNLDLIAYLILLLLLFRMIISENLIRKKLAIKNELMTLYIIIVIVNYLVLYNIFDIYITSFISLIVLIILLIKERKFFLCNIKSLKSFNDSN